MYATYGNFNCRYKYNIKLFLLPVSSTLGVCPSSIWAYPTLEECWQCHWRWSQFPDSSLQFKQQQKPTVTSQAPILKQWWMYVDIGAAHIIEMPLTHVTAQIKMTVLYVSHSNSSRQTTLVVTTFPQPRSLDRAKQWRCACVMWWSLYHVELS